MHTSTISLEKVSYRLSGGATVPIHAVDETPRDGGERVGLPLVLSVSGQKEVGDELGDE